MNELTSSLLEEMQRLIDKPSASAMLLSASRSTDRGADSTAPAGIEGANFPLQIGRFELLAMRGSGSFGIVFEAHDPKLDRRVAVKVLRPDAALSPRVQRRFMREATAAAQLDHPGIVSVYDAGRYAGMSYLAAPLCDGPNLAVWLAEHSESLSPRATAELMAEATEGVQHAHARGILHRDLKPSNILLKIASAGSGEFPFRPMISDFGLARRLDGAGDETCQGMVLGTAAYMSPEQAAGRWKDVGVASDVFSLGVILYELLTGERPFEGESPEEVLQSVIAARPVAPRRIRKSVPRDLETICLKCLAKEPGERYLSAGELAADLRRYLRQEPISARKAGAVRLVWLACRRRPVVAVLVGLLAVSLCAGTAATSVLYRRERAARQQAELDTERARKAEVEARAQRDRALGAEENAKLQRDLALKARGEAVAANKLSDEERLTALAVNDFLLQDLLQQASGFAQAQRGQRADRDVKARTLLDRASATVKERFAGRPIQEAAVRLTIGNAYSGLGLDDEAEPHLQRALELRRMHKGPRHADTRSAMLSLSGLYSTQGRYELAVPLYEQVVDIMCSDLGENNSETISQISGLAFLYQRQGRVELFEKTWQRYLNLAGARKQSLTANAVSPIVQDEETQRLQTIETVRQVRGEGATAQPLVGLAMMYQRQGRHELAEQRFREAIEVSRRANGDDHFDTFFAMSYFSVFLRERGQYEAGEGLLQEIYETKKRINGENRPSALHALLNVANVQAAANKFDSAEMLYRQIVDSFREVSGDDHSDTISALAAMGNFYKERGRHDEAAPLYEEALERSRRLFGNEHAGTLNVMVGLAGVMKEQQRYDSSAALLQQALETRRRLLGDEHRETKATRKSYLEVCQVWGDSLLSRREWNGAIAQFNEILRYDESDAAARFGRGNAWFRQKEYDTALADYDVAIQLKPSLAHYYSGRGNAWYNKREYDKAVADYAEAARLSPKWAPGHYLLANAWRAKGDFEKAGIHLKEALAVAPNDHAANNRMAWLLATCPVETYRDANAALEVATKACELTKWNNAAYLDTLAAAYAGCGNFDAAVKWQEKAIEMWQADGRDQLEARLELYKTGKPYREGE